MNHKRRRPKHQRCGCLVCKPHKDEREKKKPRQRRALAAVSRTPAEELREYG